MRSKQYVVALAGMLTCFTALADTILSENFDSVGSLPGSGWVLTNNSTTGGLTGWFQGTPGVTFAAAAGAPDSYIAANFNNAPFAGAISNWLMTPVLTFGNGTSLNFALRLLGEGFLDTVQVYYSTSGNSSNVGSTTSSTGDFTLLQTFSASDDTGWLAESVLVSGLSGSTSGRFAFRYVVDDTSLNGDFIGIDSVDVTSVASIPEPESWALMAAGLAALGWSRRRRARQ
jgi:PEP-CTERM motif